MNREILGDKKPRRYNEGLFDVVNARYGKDEIVVSSRDVVVNDVLVPDSRLVVGGFEVFEGKRYVDLMSGIADKNLILGMSGVMGRRVFGSEVDKEYFRDNFLDTVDGCAIHSDGGFKIVYDCELLKSVNSKTVLVNGGLILEDGVYESLNGVEFSAGDREYAGKELTELEAKNDPFWLAFVRNDRDLLSEYV